MVKVRFNEKIQTVETYDAGDYDRSSVPISELNDAEYNEIECYRLEMKKQTIEEYQKRWRKSRNSNNSSLSESNNSGSDSENVSPTLKSCLIRKNSGSTSKISTPSITTPSITTTSIDAAMKVDLSSSLEDDTSYFREGQAQPNIILNTPHSSDYNSDEGQNPKSNVELSSSLDSNAGSNTNGNINLFNENIKETNENKEVTSIFENRNHLSVISPLSFEGNDSPTSDNDADAEESGDESNSFIRLFEDSFEKSAGEDSDYIKDMSLTDGENSITLSNYVSTKDIPTTSFRSSKHRLFTDSLFTSSPILSESLLGNKELRCSSQLQEETPEEDDTIEREEEEDQQQLCNLHIHEKIMKYAEAEQEEDDEENDEVVEIRQVDQLNKDSIDKEEKEDDHDAVDESSSSDNSDDSSSDSNDEDNDDNVIDNHANSDSYINYGTTEKIDIQPTSRRNSDNYEFIVVGSHGKPNSFLDDLPETIHTPLSSSLPTFTKKEPKYTNFFGSPFSPPSKSPYKSSSYSSSSSSLYSSNRQYRYSSSPSSNDGSYLVSKRNYLSINRDSKPKSSDRRLSDYTTSKWEGIGSRSSNKSKSYSSNNSSNSLSSSSKYYPRPATKLVTASPFSSSWIYDTGF